MTRSKSYDKSNKNGYLNEDFFLRFCPTNIVDGAKESCLLNCVCWRFGLSLFNKVGSNVIEDV